MTPTLTIVRCPRGAPCSLGGRAGTVNHELHAGALRLAFRPDLGGAVAGLWHRETPILRSTEPDALEGARASAMYPLLPYSNRLGYRRFRWKGRDYTTRANVDDSPHFAARHRLAAAVADRLLERDRAGARPRACRRRRLAVRVRGAPVLHPGAGIVLGAAAVHQHRRRSSSRRDWAFTPTSSSARSRAARRGRRPLGSRRHQAADPQGRAAGHRRRPVASRLRPLLRRLARPGADPRRALAPCSWSRAALSRRLHRRPGATTSASSR